MPPIRRRAESPPFVGSTRFYLANWIRLWFCGWDPEDFQESGQPARFLEVQQRRSRDVYRELFSVMGTLVRHLEQPESLV